MTFGAINSLEQSVRNDMQWLKVQPLLREDIKAGIRGYVYDIKSGSLSAVE